MAVQKRYLCIGRDKKDLPGRVRDHVQAVGQLTFHEFRMAGGGDGDLCVETAELATYRLGCDASAQLYIVIDDSTNGYLAMISMIFNGDSFCALEVLAYLDELGFVNQFENLKDRPSGYKSYQGYLKQWYSPQRAAPFHL